MPCFYTWSIPIRPYPRCRWTQGKRRQRRHLVMNPFLNKNRAIKACAPFEIVAGHSLKSFTISCLPWQKDHMHFKPKTPPLAHPSYHWQPVTRQNLFHFLKVTIPILIWIWYATMEARLASWQTLLPSLHLAPPPPLANGNVQQLGIVEVIESEIH